MPRMVFSERTKDMRWQKIKAEDLEMTYTDVMQPTPQSYGHHGKHVCTEKEVSLQPAPGSSPLSKILHGSS